MVIVGVLALQGAFDAHCKCLRAIGITPRHVKKSSDLEDCDGLIIPGGESTTMMKLITEMEMRDPLIQFAKERPVFGTCAGLIILASKVDNAPFTPLGLLDISVRRNAYGRQIASFAASIDLHDQKVQGVFIRAPQIDKILSPKIEVLGSHQGMPVFICQGHLFASTFHPELTDDLFCHQIFVSTFSGKNNSLLKLRERARRKSNPTMTKAIR